jgi:phosphohistidine phosphatase SixA
MTMHRTNHLARLALGCLLLALSPGLARSQAPDWIDGLKQGGYVIVIRHGATYPDQADTDPLNHKNIAAQRQLNDDGRAKARALGDALRKLQIPIAQIYTSFMNRAVETGTLIGLGTVSQTLDVTEGNQIVSPNENTRRAQALRKLAATNPPAGSNVIVVTHKPNILDAFGKDWFEIREGEASVFKPDGTAYKLIARVQMDEWSKFAAK